MHFASEILFKPAAESEQNWKERDTFELLVDLARTSAGLNDMV